MDLVVINAVVTCFSVLHTILIQMLFSLADTATLRIQLSDSQLLLYCEECSDFAHKYFMV